MHIADVSHYVRPGSELDQEAERRGTSVYFPAKVLPMLPEALSNGICSLRPHVERLTLSLIVELDSSGEVREHRFDTGVIRSAERMTYNDVEAILVHGDVELSRRYKHLGSALADMGELASLLTARRRARGSIDFDLPKSEIELNVAGEMTGIRRSKRLLAHRLIEEFMILANELVAQDFHERESPFMYRVHDEPSTNDLVKLNQTLELLGYGVEATSTSFRDTMDAARGKPEERFVNMLCLRAMRLARYQASHQGHFGLASEAYTHFTSPIRRYPDLVVHRLVKRVLLDTDEPAVDSQPKIESLAEECSRLERIAEDSEREYIERKKVRFMADKVGEQFEATITAVETFGFFVELDEYAVDGLVHLTSLHDDYYVHDQRAHQLLGEAKGRVFKLGRKLTVEVTNVDLLRRQIDFRCVE